MEFIQEKYQLTVESHRREVVRSSVREREHWPHFAVFKSYREAEQWRSALAGKREMWITTLEVCTLTTNLR